MRFTIHLAVCGLLGLAVLAPDIGAEETRAKPDFALADTNGVSRTLSDYRGKWVVLEWVDFECAAVVEQYKAPARKMQTLQRTYRAKGVVWFSISSTGAGQRGHLTPSKANAALERVEAKPTALLLDADGKVGKAFGAKVAPEVRVISPQGDVVYAGGVESRGQATTARHLDEVLGAATGGRAIPFKAQPAQGCKIEYAAARSIATGPKASDFALVDTDGVTRRLSDYRGKWVILEWVNYDCPYVQKHYASSHRSMQKLQSRSARLGIVWLSICSSARGKQGHFSSSQAAARMKRLGATPAAYLLDPTGSVGRAYGAQTTPDMRIISPDGTIEYAGGIDSIRSARAADAPKATNYVRQAIADIAARRPIAIKKARPYGCSVKY